MVCHVACCHKSHILPLVQAVCAFHCLRRLHNSLPFSNGLMQELNVAGNALSELGDCLATLPLLSSLDMANNKLTALELAAFLPHLQRFSVSDNPLMCVAPLALQPRLTSLDLSFCQLTQRSILHAVAPVCSLRSLAANDNHPLNQPFALFDGSPSLQSDKSSAAMAENLRAICPGLCELNGDPVPRQAVAAQHACAQCPALTALAHLLPQDVRTGIGVRGSARRRLQAAKCSRQHSTDGCGSMAHLQAHAQLLCGVDTREQKIAAEELHAKKCMRRALATTAEATDLHNLLTTSAVALTAATLVSLYALDALAKASPGPPQPCMLRRSAAYWQMRDQKQAAAARTVQRAWRARQQGRHKAQAAAAAAATCIQSHWRGACLRKQGLLQQLLCCKRARQHAAAARLQAGARGWRVRQKLATARLAQDQHNTDTWLDDLPDIGEDFLPHIEGLDDVQLPSGLDRPHSPARVPQGQSEAAQLLPTARGGTSLQAQAAANAGSSSPSDQLADAASKAPRLVARFRAHQQARQEALQRQQAECADAADSTAGAMQGPARATEQCGPALVPELHPAWPITSASPPPAFQGHVSPRPQPSVASTDDAPSEVSLPPVAARNHGAGGGTRRERKVAALQAEWGFSDAATADAFMRAQQRKAVRGRGQARALVQRTGGSFNDPAVRLQVCTPAIDGAVSVDHCRLYTRLYSVLIS